MGFCMGSLAARKACNSFGSFVRRGGDTGELIMCFGGWWKLSALPDRFPSCYLRRYAPPRETIVAPVKWSYLSQVGSSTNRHVEMKLPGMMIYGEFLELCKDMGMASCHSDAKELAKSLDNTGEVILFRNRVFLHPEQVADALAKAIPLFLFPTMDDPRRHELALMEREKAEIDKIAYGRARRLLTLGLVAYTLQIAVCFRLTFWELSWEVMEPITFFMNNTGLLLAGYLFLLKTNRDPSCVNAARTIFCSQQEKLMRKRNFDIARFQQLQKQCHPRGTSSRLLPQLHFHEETRDDERSLSTITSSLFSYNHYS
eukprot:c370_g1_i1 orf=185-1126(+)